MTAGPILTTVLDHDPYTELPHTFLVCNNDMALPAAYQEMMIGMQTKIDGVNSTVYRCDAGHSPHLTWTDGLVGCIREWAGSIV